MGSEIPRLREVEMGAMTMVFVLTEAPASLDGGAWAAACAALGRPARGEGSGATASVSLEGGVDVMAGAMPAAVPGLAEDNPRSILWPDAEATLRSHRGHVVVVANGEDPVAVRRDLAVAATALAVALRAPGLVWAELSWLISTSMAQAMVAGSDGDLAVALCVGLDFARLEDGQISALSRGLPALGHLDLWISSPTMDLGELAETVWTLAGWVVGTGTTLKEGETLGRDADERLPVHHVPSPTGSGDAVVRVVYP